MTTSPPWSTRAPGSSTYRSLPISFQSIAIKPRATQEVFLKECREYEFTSGVIKYNTIKI
jgi:hypothetical protein